MPYVGSTVFIEIVKPAGSRFAIILVEIEEKRYKNRIVSFYRGSWFMDILY